MYCNILLQIPACLHPISKLASNCEDKHMKDVMFMNLIHSGIDGEKGSQEEEWAVQLGTRCRLRQLH